MNRGYNRDAFRSGLPARLAAAKAGKRASLARKTPTLAPKQSPPVLATAVRVVPLPAVIAIKPPQLSPEELQRLATAATAAVVARIVANSNPSSLSAKDKWDALPARSREILAALDAGYYLPNAITKGNR
jgi:hypothetical protein